MAALLPLAGIPLILAVAAGTPQISVSPAVARPGTTLLVQGDGFRAEVWIQLAFDEVSSGNPLVQTDGDGRLSAELVVPVGARPGDHRLTAVMSMPPGSAPRPRHPRAGQPRVLASARVVVEPRAGPAAAAPPGPGRRTEPSPSTSVSHTASPAPTPTVAMTTSPAPVAAVPSPSPAASGAGVPGPPAATPSPRASPTPAAATRPSGPIRAAFYYPWFPNAWSQGGISPYTRFEPVLGYYDSSNPTVIRQHIAWMRQANIQVGISSWWGIGHHTDVRVPALLAEGFTWTLYYEKEGNWDPAVAELRADLDHIAQRYASHPAYLRIGGRPVLFVYGGAESCATADRWIQANQGQFYLVMKVWSDYRSCASAAAIDSWHQYSPGHRTMRIAGESFSVSAGFWKMGEAQPRLERDPAAFKAGVAEMRASGDPWQLVFFNEWGENSAIEPSTAWGTTYLDALAER